MFGMIHQFAGTRRLTNHEGQGWIMTGTLRAPRSRGAFSGVLLVLLGLWGGLVPFVGPYWHFAYTPDSTWTTTDGRWYLSVAPAVATVLGGLIVLGGANRLGAAFGAWLAVLGGAWFAVGGPLSTLWTADGANAAGSPVGTATRQVVEQLTFFTGLGVVIVFFGALALGRFTVVGVREARRAETAPAQEAPGPYREGAMSRPMPAAEPEREADPDEYQRGAPGWEREQQEEPYRGRYARRPAGDERVAGPTTEND
jgi:hypothetical protein